MQMTQTLLIERVMDQTRMAVIEDDRLCELYCERPGSENLTGNIYLGRVENVLSGMNAAFVDIGADKNGFLAAGDIRADLVAERELSKRLGKTRIEEMARRGGELLVQVVKSQPGAKGPRLSCQITLPGRLMVLLSEAGYVGVSRKIEDATERARLRGIGLALTSDGGPGLILRTAAAGASEDELNGEFERLFAQWRDILGRAKHCTAPKLLHDDNSLMLIAVRNRLGEAVDALWVDGAEDYKRLRGIVLSHAPQWADRVRLHDSQTPLFDLYRVDAQADKALQKYVWLKSGGSLVIEETEALTTVDVNTGKNVGNGSAEETILANNLEAGRELMRQLRLRDIGGIVIVDFIDMEKPEHRQRLLDALREWARLDANRVNVLDMTALGLVEITRKKVRQSLAAQLLHTCSHCGGNGTVFSHETTARRALRDIWRRRRAGDAGAILCEGAPQMCDWMRTIGAPGAGEVFVRAIEGAEAGEYRLSTVAAGAPGRDCKPLK